MDLHTNHLSKLKDNIKFLNNTTASSLERTKAQVQTTTTALNRTLSSLGQSQQVVKALQAKFELTQIEIQLKAIGVRNYSILQ
jgi:hypothetical protein